MNRQRFRKFEMRMTEHPGSFDELGNDRLCRRHGEHPGVQRHGRDAYEEEPLWNQSLAGVSGPGCLTSSGWDSVDPSTRQPRPDNSPKAPRTSSASPTAEPQVPRGLVCMSVGSSRCTTPGLAIFQGHPSTQPCRGIPLAGATSIGRAGDKEALPSARRRHGGLSKWCGNGPRWCSSVAAVD